MKNPFVWLLSQPIRFYRRFISPLTPPICRYTPSCSKYALQALEEWGAIRGTGLALWRILRCNPFGSFGPDPVPINRKKREKYKKIDPGKNKRRDIQDSDKNTTEDA